MSLGKVLADVENAPGVGGRSRKNRTSPFSISAAAIIGSSPAQASTSPRSRAVRPSGCCSRTSLASFSVSSAPWRRADQEDVRVGAAGDGDALALQVGDLGDARVLAGDERRPFRARIGVDRLDRVAVDPREKGRGARRGAEIDGAGVEELQRLVGAERLHPAHLMPSLSASSRRPFSFRTRLTGL